MPIVASDGANAWRPLRLAVPILLCAWLAATSRADDLVPYPAQRADVPYPTHAWAEGGATDPTHTQGNTLLDRAFMGARPESLARTKAIVVVHGGRIVAE